MWYIFHGKIPKHFQCNKTGNPHKRFIHHTYILLKCQFLVMQSMSIAKQQQTAPINTQRTTNRFLTHKHKFLSENSTKHFQYNKKQNSSRPYILSNISYFSGKKYVDIQTTRNGS